MVTSVLLKVAMTWTTPSDSTTRLVFLTRLGAPCSPSAAAAPSGAAPWAAGSAAGLGCPWSAMSYFLAIAFFLPAIVRRGPFLVRALVLVRCPRTGRPRRWRTPR